MKSIFFLSEQPDGILTCLSQVVFFFLIIFLTSTFNSIQDPIIALKVMTPFQSAEIRHIDAFKILIFKLSASSVRQPSVGER